MRYEQPPAADRETADLALMGSRNADTEPLEREGASDQHSAVPKAEAPVDTASPRRKVLHRKTEATPAPPAAADKDPVTEAALVAADWRGSAEGIISVGVRIDECLRCF